MKKIIILLLILLTFSCSKDQVDRYPGEITYIKVLSTTPQIGSLIDSSNYIIAKLEYGIRPSDLPGMGNININVSIRCISDQNNKIAFTSIKYDGMSLDPWRKGELTYNIDLDNFKFMKIYHPIEIRFEMNQKINGAPVIFYYGGSLIFKN